MFVQAEWSGLPTDAHTPNRTHTHTHTEEDWPTGGFSGPLYPKRTLTFSRTATKQAHDCQNRLTEVNRHWTCPLNFEHPFVFPPSSEGQRKTASLTNQEACFLSRGRSKTWRDSYRWQLICVDAHNKSVSDVESGTVRQRHVWWWRQWWEANKMGNNLDGYSKTKIITWARTQNTTMWNESQLPKATVWPKLLV